MSRLLCDSGVWIAARDPDERFHDASRRLIKQLTLRSEPIGALDLTLYEVANVATVRWRSPAAADELVELVRLSAGECLVAWDGEMLSAASRVALDHQMSVYDAAYATASHALGWTLVSTDLRDLVEPGFAVTPDQIVV